MKKGDITNNHTLAGLIFILWSLGVIVLPLVQAEWLVELYLAMQVGVFCFTLLLVSKLLRNKHAIAKHAFQLSLYAYVLVALAISFYLMFSSLSTSFTM